MQVKGLIFLVSVDFSLKIVRWTEDITLKVQLWDIAGKDLF